MKKLNENPFYGMTNMLKFFQQVPKMGTDVNKTILFSLLNNAWNEATTIEKKQLFFVVFFKHMDITNRDHNLLVNKNGKGKSDKGGDANRKVGIYQMEWLLSKDKDVRKYFYALLPIIPEYTNNQLPIYYQLRTERKSGKLIEVLKIVPNTYKKEFIGELSSYFSEKIRSAKTSDMEHTLIAKFLPKPKFSKRTRKFVLSEKKVNSVNKRLNTKYNAGDTVIRYSELQEFTKDKEQFEADFIYALSKKMSWDVINYENNVRYIGLEEYKAKYNRTSEAFLFSQKGILEYDSVSFKKWLDKLPSGARYKVQCRLFNVDNGVSTSTKKWIGKYGDLADFYQEWLDEKTLANDKVRELESKENLSDDEIKELEKAKKSAKVNTGAKNTLDALVDFFKQNISKQELNVICDNILKNVNITVPVFTFLDRSGSMQSNSVSYNGINFTARDMGKLALTVFLLKNPDTNLQSIFGMFSSEAEIITDYNYSIADKVNRYSIGNPIAVNKPIIDRSKNFLWNFENVSKIVETYTDGRGTSLSSISNNLKRWVESDPNLKEERKEMVAKFPVWLAISDGDINSSYNATASVQQFMMEMKQYFGWTGVLVIWDVKDSTRSYYEEQTNKFEGIENVMYFGSFNYQVLTQIFSNIHDLDIIDIYTPLVSMFRSNRYEPVKEVIKLIS